ncbi:alpha/beta hydrolase [Luteibacter yeojuensis]|uniref:DUF1749 domain-containing protein n=1 Tax=Luteibacter yeojuensis TaxID=345309 RepID=A0A7X5TNZ5_9GAMM|nr:alpha/beta hydrolase [Luteibacter yeojuensis]NID14495.1 DUF1749 domain-containing protein [Luteibacter yeojuensis]
MPELHEQEKDHYLVSANGRLGNPPQSAVSEVVRILDLAIGQAPEKGLVIHFHGGLVAREYALNDIAARLAPRYARAGAYPLFFVWESGLKEAILNNRQDLLKDPAFRELVKKVSEWVLKKVSFSGGISFKGTGGRSIDDEDTFRAEYDQWFDGQRDAPPVEDADIAGAPGATARAAAGEPNIDLLASDIEQQLDNDPAFKQAMAEAFNAANPPQVDVSTKGAGTTKRAAVLHLSQDALDEMFPPDVPAAEGQVKTRGFFTWAKVAYFVAKIVIAVVKRFRAGRDHGVYCTIVEEVMRSAFGGLLGAAVWNAMKKDTKDSFDQGPDTCGYLVVQKLKAMEDEGKRFKKITLIGHSTGAIYICNFLDAAKAAGLETPVRVVFLAPAITCERFAAAIHVHEATYLQDFRMFAMHDTRETADQMFRPLYTHSLLYFVSGLLEGSVSPSGRWTGTLDMPLVGMERFFTGKTFDNDASVKRVRSFLNAKPQRMVWSKAAGAGPGLNSDSGRHGDFDNDAPTLTSLEDIIKG